MISVFRNLDWLFRRKLGWRSITLLMVALPLVWFSIQAWRGDHFALALLIFFVFIWMGLAVADGLLLQRVLRDWRSSIDSWSETHELLSDVRSLLIESLNSLHDHDRDKAEEIRERANMITALRIRNMEEKEARLPQ